MDPKHHSYKNKNTTKDNRKDKRDNPWIVFVDVFCLQVGDHSGKNISVESLYHSSPPTKKKKETQHPGSPADQTKCLWSLGIIHLAKLYYFNIFHQPLISLKFSGVPFPWTPATFNGIWDPSWQDPLKNNLTQKSMPLASMLYFPTFTIKINQM